MLKQKYFLCVFCLAVISLFAAFAVSAQEKTVAPDLSAAGVRLGNRATAKTFLEGYQPRIGEDSRPTYYFYNRSATQVMKLTGASFDDRFLIVEIEVYKVGKSYTSPHFQADKIGFFKTENDIFVGYKQSTASAITGIPNVDGKDRTGPQTVAKKLGAPTNRLTEGERETLFYEISEIEIADEAGKTAKYAYAARYEFSDDKLKRFILKITPRA
jgi:hypothetical protein